MALPSNTVSAIFQRVFEPNCTYYSLAIQWHPKAWTFSWLAAKSDYIKLSLSSWFLPLSSSSSSSFIRRRNSKTSSVYLPQCLHHSDQGASASNISMFTHSIFMSVFLHLCLHWSDQKAYSTSDISILFYHLGLKFSLVPKIFHCIAGFSYPFLCRYLINWIIPDRS